MTMRVFQRAHLQYMQIVIHLLLPSNINWLNTRIIKVQNKKQADFSVVALVLLPAQFGNVS